jgi:outer membrane lipoprotein-sorting protein
VAAAPAAPAKPIVTAAVPPAPVAPQEPLSQQAVIERANAYFSNVTTLVAEFTQIGADGRRQGGTLFLQRPGRLRFDYDSPATLQIVADGSSVAVRDRKLATQDLYSINQTPLKFLLRERVNLGQDIRITASPTTAAASASTWRTARRWAAPPRSCSISIRASKSCSNGASSMRRGSRPR